MVILSKTKGKKTIFTVVGSLKLNKKFKQTDQHMVHIVFLGF